MIALLLSPAMAWTHRGTAWESFPIHWSMDDAREDSLPDDYDLEVVKTAWDNWNHSGCTSEKMGEDLDQFDGRRDLGSPDPTDGTLGFYWDDPGKELGTGVYSVSLLVPSSTIVKVANGTTYYGILGVDIVFNDGVDFATTEEASSGSCSDQIVVEGIATHEIGHLLGLGHSCEQGEVCTEPARQQATMYWYPELCDPGWTDPGEDDIAGLHALYGPSISLTSTVGDVVSGVTPLEVSFKLEKDDSVSISSATWYFGDGGTSTELGPTHSYGEDGQFTVRSEGRAYTEACGEFSYSDANFAMVTACSAPTWDEEAAGFFQMEEVEGLRWRTINHTDMDVYGCVDSVTWEVYEGAEVDPAQRVDLSGMGDITNAWAPELQFPHAGTYTVRMSVGGPAGTEGAKLTIAVEEAGGCSTAPIGGMSGVAALAGLAALRRRKC